MFQLTLTSRAFDKIESRCAVLPLFADERPFLGRSALVDWRLNGRLAVAVEQGRFEANLGETLLLPTEGRLKADTLMVIGLGMSQKFDESLLSPFAQSLFEKLVSFQASSFVLCLSDIVEERFAWRNALRLFVSRWTDFPIVASMTLAEPEDLVREAKKRNMDFGLNVSLKFETGSSL